MAQFFPGIKYFASEIDKPAASVTRFHWQHRKGACWQQGELHELGDVRDVLATHFKGPVHLLIGGTVSRGAAAHCYARAPLLERASLFGPPCPP